MSKRTVIGIRTHKWDEEVSNFYQMMLNVFKPEDIYIVCEELTSVVNIPSGLNKVSLTTPLLKELGVKDTYEHDTLGWLCGDYSYYALHRHVDADFYWLIESDVYFTPTILEDFFEKMSTLASDGLFIKLNIAPKGWHWLSKMERFSKKVYQVLFSISRLSNRAIELCLEERKTISQKMLIQNLPDSEYPNDESVVASTLVEHGYSIDEFSNYYPEETFSNVDASYYRTSFVSVNNDLNQRKLVIHPKVSSNRFVKMISNDLKESIDLALKSKRIKEFRLAFSDIPSISSDIELDLLSYVRRELQLKLVLQAVLDKFLTIKIEGIDCQAYTWEENIVVLDITYQGKQYAIDVFISDGMLHYHFFSRSHSENFAVYVKKMHPELTVENNRVIYNSVEPSVDIDFQLTLMIQFVIDVIKVYDIQNKS